MESSVLFGCSAFLPDAEGKVRLSDETTAYGYFSPAEIATLGVMEHHVERIADSFSAQEAAYIR